ANARTPGDTERAAGRQESLKQSEPFVELADSTSYGTSRQDSVPRAESDQSFRLGDLFKDKEPDIFSQWDQEDEVERRIHERRERRRAEAAKRVYGDDDVSRMKTAAALFIAREGVRNFFGKLSDSMGRDAARDEEERQAEKAIRELADAREKDDASESVKNGSLKRATRENDVLEEDDVRETRSAREKSHAPEKSHVRKKHDAVEGRGKGRRPMFGADENDRRDSTSAAASSSGRFGFSARFSGTMIAWLIGGAAGAAAVIIIAFIIVNSHVVGVSAGDKALGFVDDKEPFTAVAAEFKDVGHSL
ncbi:MAG: hypothetical protein LBS67_06970, partial [Clostridiales Family XIII bacterium]|nr:hypothetical protein [Clostridiales Family XIII bacterium]